MNKPGPGKVSCQQSELPNPRLSKGWSEGRERLGDCVAGTKASFGRLRPRQRTAWREGCVDAVLKASGARAGWHLASTSGQSATCTVWGQPLFPPPTPLSPIFIITDHYTSSPILMQRLHCVKDGACILTTL